MTRMFSGLRDFKAVFFILAFLETFNFKSKCPFAVLATQPTGLSTKIKVFRNY